MKIYSLGVVCFAIIIAAFLIMPIGIVCAYSSGDNSDRLSSGSSSVFSPGYINAAKQKTEVIRDQVYPQKSFMERLVESIKKGLSNNVDETADTKVTADVKKKTSAKNTAVQSVNAVEAFVNLNLDEVPAYVRDEIQNYVGAHNNSYSDAYTLKYSNDKYYVFWKDSVSSIKAQTFDSSGTPIFETPTSLTGGGLLSAAYYEDEVSILPNGTVAVFWSETDSNSNYSLKTQRFDSSGIVIPGSLTILTGGRLLTEASIGDVSILPNGKVAVFWVESDSNYNYSLKTQTFNSSGVAIPETLFTLTDNRLLYAVNPQNVSILHGGNVAVFWYESDLNYKYSLKTQTFDPNGIAIVGSLASLTGGRLLNSALIDNVSILSNGNIAVFWYEMDSNYQRSLKTQRFNSSGIVMPGTLTSLTGDRLLNDANTQNISILPNGNVTVFWNEIDANYNYSLRTQTFNSEGITIDGSLISLTADRLLDCSGIKNVSILPNGSVAVFWYEHYSNNDYCIKTQRFNSSGIAMPLTLTNLTGDSLLNGSNVGGSLINSATISNVSILTNGNVAVSWIEHDANYYCALKTRTFDSSGIAIGGSSTSLTDDRSLIDAYIYDVYILSDDSIAVFWSERDLNSIFSLKTQRFDSSGVAIDGSLSTLTGGRLLYGAEIFNASILSNGKVIVFWCELGSNNKTSLKTQTFNSNGIVIGNSPSTLTNSTGYLLLSTRTTNFKLNICILPHDKVVAFWNEKAANKNYSIMTQTFNSNGIAIGGSPTSLTGDRLLTYGEIKNVSIDTNGKIAVFWYERDSSERYYLKTQALNASGSFVSNTTLRPSSSLTNTGNLRQDQLPDKFLNSLKSNILNNSSYGFELRSVMNNSGNSAVPEIFKTLLSSKGALATNMGRPTNEAELGRLITRALNSQIGVPGLSATEANMPEMQIALALANILKNPTEDQKLIIDAIESLLKDMLKIEGEAVKSEELTKAENDLLQMAAAVLLAQGIPDLLKEGDVENMKGMFKDLGASKDKVLLDYNNSIKPYYNNIAKEIAANVAVLETKGMIKKNLTEEQLKKLEPREIDRILANIRKSNDKSFELEYILQQDSKYRKEYLDPSKKLMEEHMKTVLGTFAKKLSEALEEKK